jgi:hypothetical protein
VGADISLSTDGSPWLIKGIVTCRLTEGLELERHCSGRTEKKAVIDR